MTGFDDVTYFTEVILPLKKFNLEERVKELAFTKYMPEQYQHLPNRLKYIMRALINHRNQYFRPYVHPSLRNREFDKFQEKRIKLANKILYLQLKVQTLKDRPKNMDLDQTNLEEFMPHSDKRGVVYINNMMQKNYYRSDNFIN
jgi:hypothetical protein